MVTTGSLVTFAEVYDLFKKKEISEIIIREQSIRNKFPMSIFINSENRNLIKYGGSMALVYIDVFIDNISEDKFLVEQIVYKVVCLALTDEVKEKLIEVMNNYRKIDNLPPLDPKQEKEELNGLKVSNKQPSSFNRTYLNTGYMNTTVWGIIFLIVAFLNKGLLDEVRFMGQHDTSRPVMSMAKLHLEMVDNKQEIMETSYNHISLEDIANYHVTEFRLYDDGKATNKKNILIITCNGEGVN